jgi:hypothetical protein
LVSLVAGRVADAAFDDAMLARLVISFVCFFGFFARISAGATTRLLLKQPALSRQDGTI